MSESPYADLIKLSAASGWLDLGNPREALAELEAMSPLGRDNAATFSLEWEIRKELADWETAIRVAGQLAEAAPDEAEGWVKQAYALHELKRTKDAWDCLLAASTRFKKETIIPYNLACYACQMGNQEEALRWLRRAFKMDGKKQFRQMALADPDLEPLRDKIKKLGREKKLRG